ncbi:MAG TPA: LuxR C-terminal-related transcriptional regulator [Dactylosporangium sp.]|jgi:LuxR family maltose regulon positive regulatory protein|nr:LuxR C-terminal-related transcriptional regulator [Dactylosporangium sp.]
MVLDHEPSVAPLGVSGLLLSKLVPPQLPPGHLPRAALIDRFSRLAAPGHLTVVEAPAGSGKSTLLALWARTTAKPMPVAWYSCDESDNDPVRFWAYVAASLEFSAGGVAARAGRMLTAPGTSLLGDVLPALINDLITRTDPLTLVIDDYDVISEPAIHETISFLVEHLPPSLNLVVVSRLQPPALWPTSRWRGRRILLELGPNDLRLTRAEAAELLAHELGEPLPVADVDVLYDRTEGWCAGVHLAALSLRNRPDVDDLVASFSGTEQHVADFLMTEVLDGQSQQMRTFLRRASVLDRLCAELCAHVTGAADALARLRRAEHDQLFLISLDNRGHWFRFHHLIRDVLRHELDQTEPDLVASLHRRAAEWHQAHGMAIEAVGQAIASEDLALAGRLVGADYFSMANGGRVATVLRWFDAIEPVLHADHELLLARAMTAMIAGDADGALAWLDEARAAGEADQRVTDDVDGIIALVQQVRSYGRGSLQEARRWSQMALEQIGEDQVWYGTSLSFAALASYRLGDNEAAISDFRRCLARADASQYHVLAVRSMGGLAMLYLSCGDLPAAHHWVERAGHDSRWHLLDEHFQSFARHFVLGRFDLANGHPEQAEPRLRRANELVRRGPLRLEQVEVLAALAQACGELGHDRDAARFHKAGQQILDTCCSPGHLLGVDSGRLVTAAAGEPDLDGLTERERTILAVLAEGLTNAQIARRLHVSDRTVASHLRSIYRKTGASNRGAATRYALDHRLNQRAT